jgi:hypothetical protein
MYPTSSVVAVPGGGGVHERLSGLLFWARRGTAFLSLSALIRFALFCRIAMEGREKYMACVCFCFRGKENMAVHGIRGKIWNQEGKIWDVASLLLVWLCTPARWHFLIGWSILARPSRQPLWSAIVPHLTLLASFRFCFFSPWPTFLSLSCEYILKIHGNVAALYIVMEDLGGAT